MIRAIVFDFDGLILDTELPEFQSWQEIYQAHGCTLPLAVWATCIGTTEAFDPYAYLEEQLGRAIDREAVQRQQRQEGGRRQPERGACRGEIDRPGTGAGLLGVGHHQLLLGITRPRCG